MTGAEFRRARSCYRHLAGRSGVALLEHLLARRWVTRGRGREYALTGAGHRALARRGFAVAPATRGRGCTDLTERRAHLAGPLGRALLAGLLASGRLARRRPGRALAVRGTLL